MAIMENKKAILLIGNERINEIANRLRDYEKDDLLFLYRRASCYDSSFEFANTFDIDDLTYIFSTTANLVYAIICGNVTNIIDKVRFDKYGNLENVTDLELYADCENYVEELAEWLIDNYNCIDGLYTEDEELLDAWNEVDNVLKLLHLM